MSPRRRLVAGCLVLALGFGALAAYALLSGTTPDRLGRQWREFQRGERSQPRDDRRRSRPGRPHRANLGRSTAPQELREETIAAALSSAGAAAALAALLLALRTRARYRRRRQVVTWKLVLGREDLAMPYEVSEAFEALHGALLARWYRRLPLGQDHFCLETHHTPTGEIAFTVAAPAGVERELVGVLQNLYPDVEIGRLGEGPARPTWLKRVVRLKKARAFVLALQSTKDYQHSFVETLSTTLACQAPGISVQLCLTPAPMALSRHARALLKQRERTLNYGDRNDPIDPGTGSVVEAKELEGALDTQHRSLYYLDLRVAGTDQRAIEAIAGLFRATASENELVRRHMRLRRRLYAARATAAMPNPLPGLRRGVVSSVELATLWHLPRTRVKHAPIARAAVRRASAALGAYRDPERWLLHDEQGPVGLDPAVGRFGLALLGAAGMGKSSVMLRVLHGALRDPERAIVLIDPKRDLARLFLGLVPEGRTVHYLDLSRPECGINPLRVPGTPEARADLFVQALIEASPPGSIQAASDEFLRMASWAVCTVEAEPTIRHVYELLNSENEDYREGVIAALAGSEEHEFLHRYWSEQFGALAGQKRFASERLHPPRNKITRLVAGIDTVLRHPHRLDLDEILGSGEILIVDGAKGAVGEDNTRLVGQVLLQLLHRALQNQQELPASERRQVTLCVDEAHNFLTRTVATMLAEGRSAGLEATFAWQFNAQIEDEKVRSGVRSLLQSVSIFRMREMEDARSMAGLAMEVYSDRIDTQEETQERLRFSVEDILRLPAYRAINLWASPDGLQAGFMGRTAAMEEAAESSLLAQRREHHLAAQRTRGGQFHAFLPDPLRRPRAASQSGSKEAHVAARAKGSDSGKGSKVPEPTGDGGQAQLPVSRPWQREAWQEGGDE